MKPVRSTNIPARAKSRRRWLPALTDPTWLVIFCGMTVIAAIVIGTVFIVVQFRERALERSKTELENVSRILAQHFDRKFDELSAAERFIAAYVERQGLSPEDYAKVLASGNFVTILRNAVGASADNLSQISLFDQQGSLIISSEVKPAISINVSQFNFFKTLAEEHPSTARTQIEMIDNPIGETQFVLARNIAGPDGTAVGVIALTVSTEQLDRFLASIAFKDRTILLVDRSAEILASSPPVRRGDMPSLDTIAFDRTMIIEATTARLAYSKVGSQTIVAARQLLRYPLTVVTTTSAAAALQSWSDETRTLLLVAGLTAAVICMMLFAIVRHLREQTRRLDVAINNMPQAILLFDQRERLIVKNSRYSEVLGGTEHVTVGRRFKDIISECRSQKTDCSHLDAYCDSVHEALWQQERTQKTLKASDGRFLQITNQALAEGGWITTIEDVTDRHRTQELTVRLAQYDSLTGLPNRASFQNHLRREMTGLGPDRTRGVLFLDLDEFKSVNDSLGHHIGDQLLKAVATELTLCLKPGEFVARLGGDEFAFVCSAAHDKDAILDLAKRILDAVRRPHDCAGHLLAIDGSIGIAIAPADGHTSDGILQSADLAMYAAKAQGKKAYRFFEPKMEADARERLRLEIELRDALANDRVEVHFQPIYDLRRRRIIACEALARWKHPDRGQVSPATFIPVAEQSGLIVQLGEMVLRQACHSAMSWPNDVSVAVNVSAIQLRNPVFALKVISALQESHLPARRLELEITEAVLIGDDKTALRILHELRAIGVRIALDDFGTGYSALGYLLRFPFDKLKIDRCFVEGLTETGRSRGIVRAAITMASELNMITTAEGVETESQRDILRNLGCDQIQGHLIATAATNERICELLNGAELLKVSPHD